MNIVGCLYSRRVHGGGGGGGGGGLVINLKVYAQKCLSRPLYGNSKRFKHQFYKCYWIKNIDKMYTAKRV